MLFLNALAITPPKTNALLLTVIEIDPITAVGFFNDASILPVSAIQVTANTYISMWSVDHMRGAARICYPYADEIGSSRASAQLQGRNRMAALVTARSLHGD